MEELVKEAAVKKVRTKKVIKSYKVSFSVNESDDSKGVSDLLEKLNDKEFGAELTIKDLALWAKNKMTDKDIGKMQKMSYSVKDQVKQKLKEFNEKNDTNLDMYEYLAKTLKIQ